MAQALASVGALQLLIMLVGLIRSKALSVLLGPTGFGIVSTIDATVVTLMILGALSQPYTALKFMARSHSDGRESFERTYAAFFRIIAALAAATTVVGVALATWLPSAFGDDMAGVQLAMTIAILGVPALMLNVFFVNTLAAAQRAAASAFLNLVYVAALAAAAIVGVLVHGIVGLYVVSALAGGGVLVGSILLLRRRLGLHATHAAGSVLAELRRSPEIAAFMVPLHIARSATSLVTLIARYSVLAAAGAAQTGVLQALLGLALTVGAVMNPIVNLVLTPLVNRRTDAHAKIVATNDFAAQLLVLLLVAALPVVLFPHLMLELLFSRAFVTGAAALWLFVLWQCLFQVVNMYVQLLIGLDDVLFASGAVVVANACSALLFAPLATRYGLGGVALALGAGMIINAAAIVLRLRTKFGAGVAPRILLRGGYSLGVLAAAGLTFRDAGATELTLAGLTTRVTVGIAATLFLWVILSGDERRQLRGLLRRARPAA